MMPKVASRLELDRMEFHPAPLIIAILFVASKVWSNLSYGGSIVTGLRSGLIGLMVYALALGLIIVLSKPASEPLNVPKVDLAKASTALIWILVCYVLMLLRIVDTLQRGAHISGDLWRLVA